MTSSPPIPTRLASTAERAAKWLFIVLGCAFVLASSGRIRTADEYMQFFQVQSLVEHGSTAVPQAVHFNNFYGTFDLRGRPRAPYPPGQAFMSTPFLDLAKFFLVHFPGVSRQEQTVFYLQVFGAVLASAVCAAGTMTLLFLGMCRLGASPRNALLVTLCVSFGTLILPYSGYFFSEPFTSVVLMAAVSQVAGTPVQSTKNAAVVGLLLAFAVWIRPTMILVTPLFVLAILLRDRIQALRPAVLIATLPAISGLGYLLWNKIIFGKALEFGYPNTAEMGKQLNTFHTPFYVGLRGFLLSPGKSIFIFVPPVLLAFLGASRLWRRDRAAATLAFGLPAIYLLFYMRYTQWEGGLCPGPRYLLPFLLVTCITLGPMLESGGPNVRRWLLGLAAFGFAVQVITYSTSFLEDQSAGAYYDSHFDYKMTYNPLVSQTTRLVEYLKGKPALMGLGFDRWFVFLHKAGVAVGTELLFASVPLFLLVVGVIRLRQIFQETQTVALPSVAVSSATL